ncbi:hypothetical protein C2857_000111 [Epichloe festucae Fl1]|uniref:Peptidase M43 pregnancy-associated plasma-A domain-containing protein n=1 Tax=Epichloe festucae (strain Fl1) TaxID=877507 RepID=A0A7S9PV30_EPIFF|nr:hypothetical protein C2857_000111 [Epichloe festucae Fl1]
MRFLLAAASFALVATSISVLPNEEPKGLHSFCGTKEPPSELHKVVQSHERRLPRRQALDPLLVDVYFHFVYSQAKAFSLLLRHANRHLKFLNDNFKPGNIAFQQVEVDLTVDPNWARDNSTREEMFHLLRKGDYSSLNVFSVEKTDDVDDLGWATLPDLWAIHEGQVVYDGVFIRDTIAADGSYNRVVAKALVHEVGHWFGLLHTFSNSCSGAGDLISDTPASLHFSGYCSETLDTCPDQPGLDPLHNHMSYSNSECRTEFTKGQYAAIAMYWPWLRAPRGRLHDLVAGLWKSNRRID